MIKKLGKEKAEIKLEQYAKLRTLSNPHSYHNEKTTEEYRLRLKKIEDRISQIEQEIIQLKNSFI